MTESFNESESSSMDVDVCGLSVASAGLADTCSSELVETVDGSEVSL